MAVKSDIERRQPLMRALGVVATIRASLYIYNSKSDVDALIDALREMREFFKV